MVSVSAGRRTDNLESHIAPQSFVARPKDLAHGSNADLLENPVMSDYLPKHTHLNTPAGMLGLLAFRVNTAEAMVSVPIPGSASCYNLCSPAYISRQTCELLYGRILRHSRSLDTRSNYVWPFKMGHNQAQEGRARCQARQDLHAAYQGNQHCCQERRRRSRFQPASAGRHRCG